MANNTSKNKSKKGRKGKRTSREIHLARLDEIERLGVVAYPPYLRGLATDRYGGNKLQHEVGFPGSADPPPDPGYVYSEQERAEYEKALRERGDLE